MELAANKPAFSIRGFETYVIDDIPMTTIDEIIDGDNDDYDDIERAKCVPVGESVAVYDRVICCLCVAPLDVVGIIETVSGM